MVNTMELLPKAQAAYDSFRMEYHSKVAPSVAGLTGSTDSPGLRTLRLRSQTHAVARLVVAGTELFNGSGELPDSDLLRSHAESMGVEPDGFIATLWSLMGIMDVIFSIENGDADGVLQVFNRMLGEEARQGTWASMPSRTPTTLAPIISQGPDPASKNGNGSKSEPKSPARSKKVTPPRRGKKKPPRRKRAVKTRKR